MRTDAEIVKALTADSKKFRLGSCETEKFNDSSVDSWDDDQSEEEAAVSRRAADYYDQHGYDSGDGVAYYIEEFDGKYWRTIAFGTGGKTFEKQCEEMVSQLLSFAYIYSCSNGFRDWSAIPKAKTRSEFDLKLATLGI